MVLSRSRTKGMTAFVKQNSLKGAGRETEDAAVFLKVRLAMIVRVAKRRALKVASYMSVQHRQYHFPCNSLRSSQHRHSLLKSTLEKVKRASAHEGYVTKDVGDGEGDGMDRRDGGRDGNREFRVTEKDLNRGEVQ